MLTKFLKLIGKENLFYLRSKIDEALGQILPIENRRKLFWKQNSSVRQRRRLTSPARPSEKAQQIYKKVFSAAKPKTALILGATPELRDMTTEQKISKYVVADFNLDMIKNNLILCSKASMENEIWIKSDWLDLPLEKKSFDCVLGDLILGQTQNQKELLFAISKLLAPRGFFITRVHIANENLADTDINNIIESVLKKDIKNPVQKRIILLWRLRDALRDANKQSTDPDKIINALIKFSAANENDKAIIDRLEKITAIRKQRNIPYPSFTKNETEKLFAEFFSKIEIENSTGDADEEYFPIYKLGKV